MHTGKIKIHSREEAKMLLHIYKPLFLEAEKEYSRLKKIVRTLQSVLNSAEDSSSNLLHKNRKDVEWNPKTWLDRILLALKIIGRQTISREITDVILEYEPHLDRTKAEKSISSALGALDKKGKIIRINDDKKRKIIFLPEWTDKK